MPSKVQWALPQHLLEAAPRLVEAFDGAVGAGDRRAGTHLACRIGCATCCLGPFDIKPLDAARLFKGLEQLAVESPAAMCGVLEKARQQWARVAGEFSGDAQLGILDDDEARCETFFKRFSDVPCPVLDPASGACLFCSDRPLSCRSFGPPLSCGGESLPACSLNFTNASEEEVAAAAIEPDPDDRQGALLDRATRSGLPAGDTVICAALVNGTDI